MAEQSENGVAENMGSPMNGDVEGAGNSASEVVLELPSYNDLSSVADVKEEILRAIGDVERLVIDGAKVERMDTPTIQLLVAARNSLAQEDVEVVFRASSETMIKSFADLGLATELEAWGI